MTWIQTRSGLAFDLECPSPEMVRIDDVAFALARLCRFTGHVEFYSVAQHSVLASHAIGQIASLDPERRKLQERAALLHDASEAFTGDINAPLKRMEFMAAFRVVEDNIQRVCLEAFGMLAEGQRQLDQNTRDLVRHVDLRMLATEKRDLLGPEPQSWNLEVPPYEEHIVPWSTYEAERRFLERFDELFR